MAPPCPCLSWARQTTTYSTDTAPNDQNGGRGGEGRRKEGSKAGGREGWQWHDAPSPVLASQRSFIMGGKPFHRHVGSFDCARNVFRWLNGVKLKSYLQVRKDQMEIWKMKEIRGNGLKGMVSEDFPLITNSLPLKQSHGYLEFLTIRVFIYVDFNFVPYT